MIQAHFENEFADIFYFIQNNAKNICNDYTFPINLTHSAFENMRGYPIERGSYIQALHRADRERRNKL